MSKDAESRALGGPMPPWWAKWLVFLVIALAAISVGTLIL